MEFKHDTGAPVQNGTAKDLTKTAQNGAAKHENGMPKKGPVPAKQEPAKPKPEAIKPEPPRPQEPQREQAPVVEHAAEQALPVKTVLNLEGTLKVVEHLHRRSVQRINLISRIKQLEAFEVNLANEHDELEENPYQGCKLIIEDSKQHRFITAAPGLVRLVSHFIFSACNEKLAEIEANIVFPKG
jgi:hypothetical protein